MSSMRPFQIILLGVFGVLALVGVLLFANFGGFTSGKANVGTVVIWGTLPADPIQSALGTYKQTHQEFKNVSYVERRPESFDSDLANAIASGNGPDLILINQEQLQTEKSKIIVIPNSSISERTYRDTYLPIDELFLTSGGTYGIPFVVDPLMMYYNRPILSVAGVVGPPAVWESVTSLAPSFAVVSGGQIQRSLVALGSYNNIKNARAILSALFLQAGSTITEPYNSNGIHSSLGSSANASYGSTPAESALTFYTEFANPSKTIYSWNQSLSLDRQTFISGDLALYFGFASEQPSLAAANPNLDFDMAALPAPGTGTTRATYGLAYVFAVPKASHNASGALRTAFLLSSTAVLPGIAQALHMAPAGRALLTPSQNDLYQAVYYPQALIAAGWLSPAPSTVDSIFSTMIENIASGRQQAHDAVFTADQSLNASLAQ